MSVVELRDASIRTGGRRLLAGLDLALAPGAALAIVGRPGSGKSLLAAALAGKLPPLAIKGVTTAARVVLLDASAPASVFATRIEAGADLIVADEPGRALDPRAQHELLAALQLANRDRGIALLVLTRDFRMPLAMDMETAILSGGRLIERGRTDRLLSHPHEAATRELATAVRPRTRTMARPPIGAPLLELHGVTKRFGRNWWRWPRPAVAPALSNVTLSVRRGEAAGLLGVAGAGKSLLLRLAAGLGRVSGGRIEFDRRPYHGADIPAEARARIAFLFPDPHAAFNPDLPVGLTLTEPLRVEEQLLIEEQAEGLVEAVRVVGLAPDVLDRLPGEFGALELQKLALARALVGRPRLIMLDEPTARLCPVEQAEFLTLFNRVRADYGLTVLCASREFDVLRTLSDHIHVLDSGQIVEGGKPGELYENGSHPATRTLLHPRYPEPPPPMPPAEPAVAEAEPVPVEPAPVDEPVLDDGADERPERREVELAVDGAGDAVGGVETAHIEPVGHSDDYRALRHVEGA